MIEAYLLKGLELGPESVVQLVKAVRPDLWDTKVDPARFSFRESVAHIADWDNVNLERIEAGLREPGCTVQGLDEGARAVDRKYVNLDPEDQANQFVQNRAKILALVKGLSEDQLATVFYHSERGKTTVHGYLVNTLGHDMYHVEHLARYLAL